MADICQHLEIDYIDGKFLVFWIDGPFPLKCILCNASNSNSNECMHDIAIRYTNIGFFMNGISSTS